MDSFLYFWLYRMGFFVDVNWISTSDIHFTSLKYIIKVYHREIWRDSYCGISFVLRFSCSLFLEKNSETYHLLIMADLPPIFISIIEVAMRIDRKYQKSIYPYVIKWRFRMLFNSLPWSITFMVVYNYSGEKILSTKMPHICTRFYNKLCRVSEKAASFYYQQSWKNTQNQLLDLNSEFEG